MINSANLSDKPGQAHHIAVQRQRHDPRTKAYFGKRRAEGKSDREIRRCLKRYIAREIFQLLENPLDSQ